MSDPADLLPPNSSVMERNLSKAVARISDVPMSVRQSWNPQTCPEKLLPWLAWSFSVDEWDNSWSVDEKRRVIRNSHFVHRRKGTLSAIRRALESLGYTIRVVEWFEEEPAGVPYTFKVEVSATKALYEHVYEQICRIVGTYKNERSHLRAIDVRAEVSGRYNIGFATLSGIKTTVYPYIAEDMISNAPVCMAGAGQSADCVCIYP